MPYNGENAIWPNLNQMIEGGARYAQAMRAQEAFKLEKEDREYARQQKEKQEEFARRSRELAAAVQNAEDPKEKSAAYTALATHSPEGARALQKFETDQSGALLEQQAAQFELQNKQELDAARAVKQSLETFKAAPSYDTMKQETMRLKLAQKQGIPISPDVIAGFEATSSAPESPQFVDFYNTITRAADDTITRLSPAPKPVDPFRPGASVLDQARVFSTLAAERGMRVDTDMLFGPRGPSYAMQLDAPLWALSGKELDRVNAAKGSTTINNLPPGVVDPTGRMMGELQGDVKVWTTIGNNTAKLYTAAKEHRDYFGVEAGVKAAFLRGKANVASGSVGGKVIDPLTPEQEAWLGGRQELITQGTKNLYDFMVMESGKAITEPERKLLIKAFGDPESMTDVEYAAAMETLNKLSVDEVEIANKYMRGFDTRTMEEYQSNIDEKRETLDALRSGGMSPKVAEKKLRAINAKQRMLFSESSEGPGVIQRVGKYATPVASPAVPTPKGASSTPATPVTGKSLAARAKAENWSDEQLKAEMRKYGLLR